MTAFAENMEGLVSDIASSRENRQAWLDDFRRDARAAARERRSFVKSLQSEVGEMLEEIRSDLQGARRAWQGRLTGTNSAPDVARPRKRTRRSG